MKSNFKDGSFHLSVNKDGLVSLWDFATLAKNCPDEKYVRLCLTGAQRSQLNAAVAGLRRTTSRRTRKRKEPL